MSIGVGSVLDVSPSRTRFERFVPAGTCEERMREVWSRVGDAIQTATGRLDRE